MIDDLDHPLATDAELAECAAGIEAWILDEQRDNPFVVSHERDPANRRWLVRLRGDEKDITAVWFTLGQRTLHYETYVMPAPEENHAAVYEQALRRNDRLVGAHFAIGVEDALFLRGDLPLAALTEAELDRVIGSLYAYVEQSFPSLIRLGYASRFQD